MGLFLPAFPATARQGASLAGARWRFYASGTDRELRVYSDMAGRMPVDGPIIAGPGGRMPVVTLDANHVYRAVLTAPDGSVLMDIDPVQPVPIPAPRGDSASRPQPGERSMSVSDFGALGDDATDDSAAFAEAIAYCVANRRPLIIPPGRYRLAASGGRNGLNFAGPDLCISGVGRPVLRFHGTGRAFVLDVNAPRGNGISGMLVENLIIEGVGDITDGFFSRGIVRSAFRNIEVRNVSGKAFHLLHAVSNQYDSLKYSTNDYTPARTPSHGLYIDNNEPGYYTSDCTFINPVMEGFDGVGCALSDGSGNVFLGGTFERVAIGLQTSPTSRGNAFHSVWFEENTRRDAEISGVANSFRDCRFWSNGVIEGNVALLVAQGSFFEGGYARLIDLSERSANTRFHAVITSDHPRLGFLGLGSFTRLNCLKADRNMDISGRWSDVVGAAGIMLPGGQLSFPATAVPSPDARTLDDYHEGVWAPALVADRGTIAVDPERTRGTFTKIGNVVHAHGIITVRQAIGVSGALGIAGLPFASHDQIHSAGSVCATGLRPTAVEPIDLKLSPNSRALSIVKRVAGTSAPIAGDVRPGTELIVSICYQAA